MTRPGIEPLSLGTLTNTLNIMPLVHIRGAFSKFPDFFV